MKNHYPKQIYDPLRRRIAAETIQKELRKLLPSVPETMWPKLDHDVENWFEGKESELATAHDFWNGFEGITQGFKLKGILPYLTAENIEWDQASIPSEKIVFTTNLPILDFLGESPFKSQALIDFINSPANKNKIQEIIQDSDKHAASSVERDHYPIIVLAEDDNFRLLDGHRRVVRAIFRHQENIEAYVGKFNSADKTPKNNWVSTGFLRNLIRIWDINYEDKKISESIKQIFIYLLKNHDNVRYIFPLRVLNKNNHKDEIEEALKDTGF